MEFDARPVALVDYDSAWSERFLEEAARIAAILDSQLVAIHHVGSTSIQHMPAKPVIDLVPVVRSINTIDVLAGAMEAIGYKARGEYGLAGRRFFVKDVNGVRTHNVHIWQQGHPQIARHLDFRDFLNAHGDDAEAYADLKQKLVRRFPNDVESYCEGKSTFIRAIERRARQWRLAQRFQAP